MKMNKKNIILIALSIALILFIVIYKLSLNDSEKKEEGKEYDLSEKTIVSFGDSIFAGIPSIAQYLSEATGATVYNTAFGGCLMSLDNRHWDEFSMCSLTKSIINENFQSQDSMLESDIEWPGHFFYNLATLKSINFNKVDIITIAYGTNDFAVGQNMNDLNNKYDVYSFEGALRYSIENIKNKYPHIEIVLCTPIYRFWLNNNNEFIDDSNTHVINGQKLTDFVQRVKEIGNEYNLLVIDNYYRLDINQRNCDNYFTRPDSVHPNVNGRKLMADNMAKTLYERFK